MDAANTSNPSDKKKFIWLVILLIIAIVVAVVWWWNYRKYVSTIDANLGWQSCECVRPCDGPFVCCLQAGG
ncbi:hypothetical protein NXV14_07150 [Bacteroides fragilis]|nr:hypothetical protein [Bacteroides fragilis]